MSTQIAQWVNINDNYLIINGSIEVSPNIFQNKIIRIKSTDPCPVILDDDVNNTGFPVNFYSSLNSEYALSGSKFFFYKTNKAGKYFIEATDGEITGTQSLLSLNDGLNPPQINGVCTKGAIFTSNTSGSPYPKTYIWDGNSLTSLSYFF